MQRFPILGFIFVAYAMLSLVLVFGLSHYRLNQPMLVLPKPDFDQIDNVADRKQAFFDFLTPMINDQNQRVLRRRERLLSIADNFQQRGNFTRQEQRYIERQVQAYRFDDEELSTEEQLQRLLRRVDIVPVALALAQAASESGWGNSRFARTANNFFGQWCYEEGCGVVPNNRNKGARHEVADFNNVRESINSYFRNINTHFAYKELRLKREAIRQSGRTPRSEDLIPTLIQYSERREDYLEDLRQLIRVNNLNRFENAE